MKALTLNYDYWKIHYLPNLYFDTSLLALVDILSQSLVFFCKGKHCKFMFNILYKKT